MRHKILWVSKTDPNKQIRPDTSSLTYLEAISIFGMKNPEISRATNYKEFKDAININKDNFFLEICIDYQVDDAHTGIDCLDLLIKFCLDNNIKVPQITPIRANSDERIQMLSLIDEQYKQIKDLEDYM